jgi:glycosyltransferase involved in cell wall biosynthesis
LTPEDVVNLLGLAGLEVVRQTGEVLCPFPIPLLRGLADRYLVHLQPFRQLAMTNVFIARLQAAPVEDRRKAKVSVIVAARNEAGNIAQILERTPQMGGGTELIFVEGNSTDNTWEVIQREVAAHPEVDARAYQQPGKGKGDAVRKGYREATGDLYMILDADLTVAPEDLPRFYEAWASGKGDFINGVRLVYPMRDQAMRFANHVANKGFSLGFSWLLGQPIKDTLCGTKVLSATHYRLLAANRAYFGDFDPYGDFDLIFGAARFNLKIVDIPIRYRERTYGETNISRWSGGVTLLRMFFFALRRLRFV